MPQKEAKARIEINKILEDTGWRLVDGKEGKANVLYETNVMISHQMQDDWGKNFEHTKNGFIDYLLLDDHGYPLAVLEAKSAKNGSYDHIQPVIYSQIYFTIHQLFSSGREMVRHLRRRMIKMSVFSNILNA